MSIENKEFAIRSIPFGAMGGVYGEDDIEAVMRTVRAAAEPGGDFFPLPEENQFHEALCRHEGAKKAVGVNSCGTALDLCMMALGIGPGDEVITTPLTFVCTATCAMAQGARVVFADIDPRTLCLDPEDVCRRISDKTKAVIPVHFAGLVKIDRVVASRLEACGHMDRALEGVGDHSPGRHRPRPCLPRVRRPAGHEQSRLRPHGVPRYSQGQVWGGLRRSLSGRMELGRGRRVGLQ